MPKSTKNCVRPFDYSIKRSEGFPTFSRLPASYPPAHKLLVLFGLDHTQGSSGSGGWRAQNYIVWRPGAGGRILARMISFTVVTRVREGGANSRLPNAALRILGYLRANGVGLFDRLVRILETISADLQKGSRTEIRAIFLPPTDRLSYQEVQTFRARWRRFGPVRYVLVRRDLDTQVTRRLGISNGEPTPVPFEGKHSNNSGRKSGDASELERPMVLPRAVERDPDGGHQAWAAMRPAGRCDLKLSARLVRSWCRKTRAIVATPQCFLAAHAELRTPVSEQPGYAPAVVRARPHRRSLGRQG